MHHRQKGVVGLLVQQAERVKIEDVAVSGTENYGPPGSEACGAYTNKFGAGHRGYSGSQA